MKVLFTAPAKRALDKIYERYKAYGYGKAGRKARTKVLKKALLLKSNPHLGPIEEQLQELVQGHRYLVTGNFKIIYRIVDQTVYVTDVFDTRQDPDSMKG